MQDTTGFLLRGMNGNARLKPANRVKKPIFIKNGFYPRNSFLVYTTDHPAFPAYGENGIPLVHHQYIYTSL